MRAGLTQRPDAYEWSSHCANIGLHSDSLLSPHPEFMALGSHPSTRKTAYLSLFEQTLDCAVLREIRESTNAGYPLAPGKPGRRPREKKAPQLRRDPDLLSGSDPD